jgi:hypothetical protein
MPLNEIPTHVSHETHRLFDSTLEQAWQLAPVPPQNAAIAAAVALWRAAALRWALQWESMLAADTRL